MRSRLFSFPLVVLLALGLVVCGGSESSPNATAETASSNSTEQTAASGKVDRTVTLQPKGNEMRYEQTEFTVAPGETVEVTFTAPEEEGDHRYLCTFPGHWATMQGTMVVEEASGV